MKPGNDRRHEQTGQIAEAERLYLVNIYRTQHLTKRVSSSGAGVTPKKSSSVPLGIDGAGQGPSHQHQGSSSKKRKLFTQSLGRNIIQKKSHALTPTRAQEVTLSTRQVLRLVALLRRLFHYR